MRCCFGLVGPPQEQLPREAARWLFLGGRAEFCSLFGQTDLEAIYVFDASTLLDQWPPLTLQTLLKLLSPLLSLTHDR